MDESFLQSFEWGKFQKSLGRKIWRLENDFWQALIVKHNLPLKKSYLYCPRGPALAQQLEQENFQLFLEEIKNVAKEEKAIFFRVEPEWEDNEGNREILRNFGFQKSKKVIQPKSTLVLNITKTEDELFKKMHPKTRYNIRLAERQGVKCQLTNDKFQSFEEFWELLQQTAKRDKFRSHPKEYYKKMLELPLIKLFLARYREKIIATNIVVFFGNRATYIHGAADYKYRNLMAPHLLQWEQIKEAKRRGCTEYDFWGIDEKRWPGLTRFKKSFGGKEINYLGAYDLVFHPFWYKLYNLVR